MAETYRLLDQMEVTTADLRAITDASPPLTEAQLGGH